MPARIAIVGAGPAGCAAALTLRRYVRETEVVLISTQRCDAPDGPAVGESLSPGVLPLLEYLGIREDFLALGSLSSWSTASAWGSEQVLEREYLFSGLGGGWQVDRFKFDGWLLGIAERAGVRLISARARQCVYEKERWSIVLDDGSDLKASTIVDATGRASWFARSRRIATQRDDALVAEARWYAHDVRETNVSGALIEATPHGWWYSSMLPGRRGVAMFMTDADVRSRFTWEEKLAVAPATSARLVSWLASGETAVRAAHSQKSDSVVGKRWVSAGDAAAAFDPVSSLGIGFSLRCGIESARVAVAAVEQDDGPAVAYAASVTRIYADYRDRLRRIYRREGRWPESAFWARRHGSHNAEAH